MSMTVDTTRVSYLASSFFCDSCVDTVSKDAIEVVDDDVVDVFLVFQSGHHFLEDWPLVDARGGTAGLDELSDYVRVE